MKLHPILLALALGACAADPPGAAAPVAAPVQTGAVFEAAASDALLRQADAAGSGREAMRLYREAGLAWPANEAAWTGLARTARAAGDIREAAAAAFMLDRLAIYPSEALATQRDVNVTLKTWIAAQRALPDANPAQLDYATALAEFHDGLHALRGSYEAPRPVGNIAAREIPAALATGAGAVIYGVLLVTGE